MTMTENQQLTVILLATERTLVKARGQMAQMQFNALFDELIEALNTIKGLKKISLEEAYELLETHDIILTDNRRVISVDRKTLALFYVHVEGAQVNLQRWDVVYVKEKEKVAEPQGQDDPDKQPNPVAPGNKGKGG